MPYLGIGTESTYINVECDGYQMRFYTADTNLKEVYAIFSTTDSLLVRMSGYVTPTNNSQSGIFCIGYDDYKTVSILENNKSRIVIKVTGHFDGNFASGETYLIDSDSNEADTATYTYYIYPDRYVEIFNWTTEASITLSTDTANAVIGHIHTDVYTTSTEPIAEYNGDESTHDNPLDLTYVFVETSKYIGFTSTEINMFGILIDADLSAGTTPFHQYMKNAVPKFQYSGGDLAAGSHRIAVMWVIDAADRENGSKLYTSTERLEMGNQYKDTTLSLTTGTAVTGLTDPLSIGSSGYASDGCFHVEME